MSKEARQLNGTGVLGGTKIARALKYRMFTWAVVDRLHRYCGLLIFPYYLYIGGPDRTSLPPDPAFALDELTEEDMRASTAASVPLDGEHGRALLRQKERLRRERCFVGFVEGELVGYAWVNTRYCEVPRVKSSLFDLKPNEAYSAYMFIFDEFRGRRLAERLGHAVRGRLAEEGYARFYRIISVFNYAPLRVAARQGVPLVELRVVLGFPRLLAVDLRIGKQHRPAPTPGLLIVRDRR